MENKLSVNYMEYIDNRNHSENLTLQGENVRPFLESIKD